MEGTSRTQALALAGLSLWVSSRWDFNQAEVGKKVVSE